MYLIAFGLGAAMTGIAGAALVPIYSTFPTVGVYFSLVAFVVVVLGGLGDMMGALIAGLVIGVVENMSVLFLDPALKEVVYFVIFIVILIVKPSGLFGLGKATAEVGLE
jgi:branched-chain amino acid transport system permease protein